MAVFVLMVLIGFPEWFFTGMDTHWDGHQAAWWDTWVAGMIGIGLVDIARTLEAIRNKKGPNP